MKPDETLMKKLSLIALVAGFCFFPGDGWAGESAGQAGAFLRIGLGPRAKGMGDTYTAIADNPTAAYYNAAGLGFLTQREAIASYSVMSFDRRFNYVGFATPLKHEAGFAVGIIQSGFGDYAARGDNGAATGETIKDNQWAVFIGFALRPRPNLAIGITPKFLRSEVYDVSASSFGVDLGILYRPVENLSLGASIHDLGQAFKYTRQASSLGDQTTRDRLPRTTKLGAAYSIPMKSTLTGLLVAADVEMSSEQASQLHLGVEANFLDKFRLRIGLDHADFTAGFSVPFKVQKTAVQFDYAFIRDTRSGLGSGTQDFGFAVRF